MPTNKKKSQNAKSGSVGPIEQGFLFSSPTEDHVGTPKQGFDKIHPLYYMLINYMFKTSLFLETHVFEPLKAIRISEKFPLISCFSGHACVHWETCAPPAAMKQHVHSKINFQAIMEYCYPYLLKIAKRITIQI